MTSTTSSDPELATITIGADLHVRRIGYGAMQLAGDHAWGEYPDRDGAIALLRNVVESGITFIDTSDVYGPNTNETLIHVTYDHARRAGVCCYSSAAAFGSLAGAKPSNSP
jgi:aryl-alcohol dehydrogenase-like predicted oxidoreductase